MQRTLENNNPRKKLIAPIAIVLSMFLPFLMGGSEYALLLMCIIQLYIIAVSGLDLLFGYSGQISLGHAAFYAIGAYGSAILHNNLGIPVLMTMVIAAALAALVGAVLAIPASKLVFHFLSLATVAFGEIVYQLIVHSPGGITKDFNGIFSTKLAFFVPEESPLRLRTYFYFGLLCVVIFLTAKYFLVHSKTGRAFTAIRENSHAANGMGINVRAYKVMAFATSAFYTAFAGAMYVHLVGYVHPDTFLRKQSVLFLTMLLFGGTGSITGPILGVVAVEMLIESLRVLQDYQGFVYGILLLIVIVALPGGVFGGFKDLWNLFRRKIGGGGRAEVSKHVDN